jgi:membrane protease YdiL (CAAX protease family)
LLPDTSNPPETLAPAADRRRLLAPLWHTAVVVFVLLGASLAGSRGVHPLAGRSKLPEYLSSMAWQWTLLGFIYLGTRKRIKLRDLIGGRWPNFEAFLLDVVVAAGFWLAAVVVLAVCGKLMHLDDPGNLDSMRRQIGFMVPGTNLELFVWFCVSITAGFCEEIIFRGYLQRQFAILSRSTLVGVVLSAIVFGASHGYEGGSRMILLAIFGLMFGLLAWWRKSLRPGMIAHAWHDALSGAVMRLLK